MPRPAVATVPRTALLAAAALLLAAGAAAAGWWAHRPAPASQPTFHRLTFRRGIVNTARFAPDRKTIVYGAAWEGAPLETFLVTTDSPESRSLGVPRSDVYAVSLVATSWRCHFAPTSPLPPAAGTLARASAARRRGAARGDEQGRVRRLGPRRHDGRHARHRPRRPARIPHRHAAVRGAGPIHQIRVSPDGALVAFQEFVRGKSAIAVVDRKKQKRTLVDGLLELNGLAWTAEGNEVWFGGKSTGRAGVSTA